jgi:hypothetical protein
VSVRSGYLDFSIGGRRGRGVWALQTPNHHWTCHGHGPGIRCIVCQWPLLDKGFEQFKSVTTITRPATYFGNTLVNSCLWHDLPLIPQSQEQLLQQLCETNSPARTDATARCHIKACDIPDSCNQASPLLTFSAVSDKASPAPTAWTDCKLTARTAQHRNAACRYLDIVPVQSYSTIVALGWLGSGDTAMGQSKSDRMLSRTGYLAAK